jgi:hypothetical protein
LLLLLFAASAATCGINVVVETTISSNATKVYSLETASSGKNSTIEFAVLRLGIGGRRRVADVKDGLCTPQLKAQYALSSSSLIIWAAPRPSPPSLVHRYGSHRAHQF